MEKSKKSSLIEHRLEEQRDSMDKSTIPTSNDRSLLTKSLRIPRTKDYKTLQESFKMSSVSSTPSFPSKNSIQRIGVRKKINLEPGYSPLDWVKLNSSDKNLKGINSSEFPIKVTKEILKQHKSKDDCWTILGGKVYNITPYLKFHPGGIEEIMKCVGHDGTNLFNKYHSWVNYERMLEKCIVGFYVG